MKQFLILLSFLINACTEPPQKRVNKIVETPPVIAKETIDNDRASPSV